MKILKMIALLICLSPLILDNAVSCEIKKVKADFKEAQKSITSQTQNIENYLEGTLNGENFSPISVFGPNFELSKTNELIGRLEVEAKEKLGLTIGVQALYECLKELKLEKEKTVLEEQSLKLNQIKIALLKKNFELEDTLRIGKITKDELPRLKDEINKENQTTEQIKSRLETNLLKKTNEATIANDSEKKEHITYDNELTKIKILLLNLRLEANQNLQKKINYFEGLNQRLSQISVQKKGESYEEKIQRFNDVESLWFVLAKENYYDLFNYLKGIKVPQIPAPMSIERGTPLSIDFNQKRLELLKLENEIKKEYTDKKSQELSLLNQLVLTSNSLRSSIFSQLGLPYFFKTFFKIKTIKTIRNEVLASPYRILSYIFSKYLFVREKLLKGKEGYVYLIGRLIFFFLILGFIYGLKIFFKSLTKKVDNSLHSILLKNRGSHIRKHLFSLWNKIKDDFVSFLWLILLFIIVEAFNTSSYIYLIKGLEYYLISHLIRSLVTVFLGSISRLDVGSFLAFKKKAMETSQRFANIYLFYSYTILFVEVTIGKVYIFRVIYFIVMFYSLYQLIRESSLWENEFTRYMEKKFSGVIVEKIFGILGFFPQKVKAIFLLATILVLSLFDLFISYTENFEISKKISANLFKKQIEKVEAQDGSDDKIPSNYKDQFSLSSLDEKDEYVYSTQGIEEKIEIEVKEWLEEKSDEHSLVVYGDKGIGKTTLLKHVTAKVLEENDVDVKYVKMPAKTLNNEKLIRFLGEIFNNQEEKFDLLKIDQSLTKKTIIVIDETQNVFLSYTGGFDAYYALTKLINLNTQNIFWVMSFNKYSWLYLYRAFGGVQYFRNVFPISGWSDLKIKELIMKRHEKTNFRLSYDLLINATRSQDEIDKYASIESKFFKLLWELSRGNPRAALYLWISALSRKNLNTFNVNIPKETLFDNFDKLDDELMFVIAHVIKHENLSTSEIEQTTNLSAGIVRNAIKLAEEKGFLFRDDRGRFMVDISTQYALLRTLKQKNFIYGS
ncbi:MAG: AAA family ATPase [Bacteriovoracaceae bacterium]|nr:AAA family ATPase [Bacteriovoracaceae bacterium]